MAEFPGSSRGFHRSKTFLRKDSDDVRVVMVCSAIQGEGKTTLAVQLATRLARTGERTLLVDYDLRRPSIHRIFGMPRGPGVSDCLRNEFDLDQVVHPSDAENLFVVTAGDSLLRFARTAGKRRHHLVLRKGPRRVHFHRRRWLPDPSRDRRASGQSARRHRGSFRPSRYGEAPQVLRACEKLSAFGLRKYVVVLNGSQEEIYGDYHEHVISTRVEAVDAPNAAGSQVS